MSKLIIMQGLPASGKSTRAEEILREDGNAVRINRDLLRTMLHFDKWTGKNEGNTKDAARTLAQLFLGKGINVIIDDTNLHEGTVQSWVDLAKSLNAKIQYERLDTDPDECIKRDEGRQKRVGKHVIQKMALQHQAYLKGQKVVICDMDGTLADPTHRLEYASGEKKDWEKFFALSVLDKPRNEVIQHAAQLVRENNAKLMIVSARPERHRDMTLGWLAGNGISPEILIMREDNDKREDTEVKSDIFEKYLKNLDIVALFDDRPSVIRMWREKGLNVIDVGKGVEF